MATYCVTGRILCIQLPHIKEDGPDGDGRVSVARKLTRKVVPKVSYCATFPPTEQVDQSYRLYSKRQ